MKKVKVEFTEIVNRVAMVEVPDNIHVDHIDKYVEDYIRGYVDDSYDWRVSDIVEDDTIINHILIEDLKLWVLLSLLW